MLTVYSVLWGDKYSPGYVYNLKEMVEKHLTIPHEFICITDHTLTGITTMRPPKKWPGWWSKINLFSPEIAGGPSLYFDLDIMILHNIDYLAGYTCHPFAAPPNWAQSGHGGIQSSVMAWNGEYHEPYECLRKDWPGEPTADGYRILNHKRFWGDQEYLWHLLGDDWIRIENGIGSYKYHIQPTQGIPDWMKVCVFHGQPKPHEINDSCLFKEAQILRTHIRLSNQS